MAGRQGRLPLREAASGEGFAPSLPVRGVRRTRLCCEESASGRRVQKLQIFAAAVGKEKDETAERLNREWARRDANVFASAAARRGRLALPLWV